MASDGGAYVDAGGVRTFYETDGEGDPLLLLHGGFVTNTSWSNQRGPLAAAYRVYLPERRAHGRTSDIPGPITYVDMAADTVAFMDAVGVESAHVVGWSDGGNVGLEVALANPERVRKLVLIGAAAHLDGATEEGKQWVDTVTADDMPPFIRDGYARLSPDGADHFPIVFEKLVTLWRTEPRHAMSELSGIEAPTLVLIGDNDGLTVEHAAAMAKALPNGQLAVVPGADHFLIFTKAALVNRLILDFLAE